MADKITTKLYLDNAATTKEHTAPAPIENNYEVCTWGNPSSTHKIGTDAAHILEIARQEVSSALGYSPNDCDVIFTSGGTESINLALLGLRNSEKKHLIASKVEHSAVLECLDELEKHYGFDITYVDAHKLARDPYEAIREAIREDTLGVVVMAVNNETGYEYDLSQVYQICAQYNLIMISDYVQGAINVGFTPKVDCDFMLMFSGHKFYASKGIGCLVKSSGVHIDPIIFGGGQQNGLRAGTENPVAAIRMANNLSILRGKRYDNDRLMQDNYKRFAEKLIEIADETNTNVEIFNGENAQPLDEIQWDEWWKHQSPYIMDVTFTNADDGIGIDGDTLCTVLNTKGYCVSNGSACHASDLKPSHVLEAMWVRDEVALQAVRISFSVYDLDQYTDEVLDQMVIDWVDAISAVQLLMRASNAALEEMQDIHNNNSSEEEESGDEDEREADTDEQ